jgi:hypothetical protein
LVHRLRSVRVPREGRGGNERETEIFLDQFGAHNTEKGGGCLIGDSFSKQSLSCAWLAVEDDSLGGLDADILIELWVSERQLHCLLDLLDLESDKREERMKEQEEETCS